MGSTKLKDVHPSPPVSTSTNAASARQSLTPGFAATETQTSLNKHQGLSLQTLPSKFYDIWPCPIRHHILDHWLSGYDSVKRSQLIKGLSQGFIIPSQISTNPLPPGYSNHSSAVENSQAVTDKLEKELSLSRIAGPFDSPPTNIILSPLAAVPKRDSHEIRIIHDLSFPKESSVNLHTPRQFCHVQYELLDDCIDLILKIGKGCLMAKADIASAFRILPVSPSSYHLLGFQWGGKYFHDRVLPMGASSSCSNFELFSSAIQWILQNKLKVPYTSHILDDFMFFGSPDTNQCNNSLQSFLVLANSLGIPIKSSKTVLPSTLVQLHGLEVCTTSMEVRLPADKKAKAISLIKKFRKHKRITLVDLQSIIGTLQFATKAIVAGRCFLRRLIDLTQGVTAKHHHIRLNKEARLDLQMWYCFLTKFNGKSLMAPRHWIHSPDLRFYSDASGTGYAAVVGSHWIQGAFPPGWANVNIAVKELFPISMALRMWAPSLKGNNITFLVDNMSVVYILQSQTSKDPKIMSLLRPMVTSAMLNDIQFYAEHVPGKHNVIPDLLSRFQVSKALDLAKWMDRDPHSIPKQWLPW